jgi:aminoglycoside 6'-N-acetyltransferase I
MAWTSSEIVPFEDLTPAQRADAARVLEAAFADLPNAFDGAFAAEVEKFYINPDRWALAALDGEALVGWVGAIQTYPHAWELHPLVVDPPRQRRGVGAALTRALEARARSQGVLTLYLGTDDELGGTNLHGRDLFPDVAGKIAGIAETGGHPFAFYRKQGYEVVGLIPDANGPGKPDILMAKRL